MNGAAITVLEVESAEFPLVSWLLCAHVVNEHLRHAIASCLAQSYSNFELIVVANGTNASGVAAAVQEWFGEECRLRIILTSIRQLPFSLSFGLHHARGSLIARMDADDISHPNRLYQQVSYMNSNPNVDVLGTYYNVVDNDGNELYKVAGPLSDKEIRKSLFWGNPLCHPSVMFRKDVVINVGGYLGGLHAEDYDLWARLSLNPSCKFANLPVECLSYRVVGVGNARRSRWAYASTAGSQLRNFLMGGGVLWFAAIFFSIVKLLMRSNSVRDIA